MSGHIRPKIGLIKPAVKRFLRQLGPNHEIALIAFGDKIQMPSGFTSDRKQLERAVDQIASDPSNKTILYDALSFAVRIAFKGVEGRKALVLLEAEPRKIAEVPDKGRIVKSYVRDRLLRHWKSPL